MGSEEFGVVLGFLSKCIFRYCHLSFFTSNNVNVSQDKTFTCTTYSGSTNNYYKWSVFLVAVLVSDYLHRVSFSLKFGNFNFSVHQ